MKYQKSLKLIASAALVGLVGITCKPRQDNLSSVKDEATNAYTNFEYGKECFDTMGVELPEITCDGPESSRLKIEVNGKEIVDRIPDQCDKPGLAATPKYDGTKRFDCAPGGRITKHVAHNSKKQEILTIVLCRKIFLRPLKDQRFENISILQANTTTNDICWFQMRHNDNPIAARKLPPPYSKTRIKGDAIDQQVAQLYLPPQELTADGSECIRCHDSQIWVRSPWISKANQVDDLNPQHKNDNQLPQDVTPGRLHHVGANFQAWNSEKLQPQHIDIDAGIFDAKFAMNSAQLAAKQQNLLAPSDTCTQCHKIGRQAISNPDEGSCNHFTKIWHEHKSKDFTETAMGSRLTAFGGKFPQLAWMPPGSEQQFNNQAAWLAYYQRAFQALEICCTDPKRPGCQRQL